METKNYFTKSNWKTKTFQFAGLIAISFAVLISCQKKSDSGTVYATPAPIVNNNGIVGNCAGCNFAQTQLAQPISRSSYFTIQWNMLGDQAVIQQLQYNYGGYSSAKNYVGQIVLTGTMNVTTPITSGYGYGCQIPVGQYQITNYNQVGQMTSGGFLSTMQLVATGNGVQILFTLSNGMIGDLNGSGQITHINGMLIPTTGVVNGQQVTCSDPGFYVTY
ncbi:MAG: hypothetical protein JNM24_00460 [Bdellovibrionaceae bacterium]|nr:hypothetical protein [Pseudobdellovibrionaceae bacterium]